MGNEVPMPIADAKFKSLTTQNVNRAPRKRGVYAIYSDKTLVFLGHAKGKSDTIRSRLRAHLAATPKVGTRYKREPSASPEARLKGLLKEYFAAHGRMPASNATT
jgi:hypothetical protein